MATRLRLADLLAGLSIAADLGFGLPPESAMRSCVVGTALARRMDVPETEVADTFYAVLLLHVGCTTFAHETSAAFGDERSLLAAIARANIADPRDLATKVLPEATRGLGPVATARMAGYFFLRGQSFGRRFDTGSCEAASTTARRIGLGEGVQRALYEIPEWWKGGSAPRGLKGEEIALAARIAVVAATAVALGDMGDADLVSEALGRQAGGILDPSVVAAFRGGCAELLAEARVGDPRERMLEVEPEPVLERDQADLAEVAAAFGDLGDLKTPFSHGHSAEVARLATGAADRLRLDAATVSCLEVAARLHDLGRAAVSNAIWEKPGPLTSAEWEQVRMHPYHSERILATSRALEPMAPIVGKHHERLDGSGYHRGCQARDLPPAARILAAADAFQAMTQERPHRATLSPEDASDQLMRDARAGRLDSDVVGAVLDVAGQRRGRRADLRPGGLSDREIEVVGRAHEDGTVDQIIEDALEFPHKPTPEAMKRLLDAFAGHETADRLGGIAAPTLVMAGGQDIVTPPHLGRSVAEGIPGARFEVLPDEAHQPFQEVPDQFNARVDAFWSEVGAGDEATAMAGAAAG